MAPQGSASSAGAGRRRVAGVVAITLVWAALFGPSLVDQVRTALDPRIFTDDARQQVWPFYRFTSAGFRSPDWIADYYLSAFMPTGYRAVFGGLARRFDPAQTSKVAPYVLFAIVLGLAVAASARLGGGLAALACGGLVLATPVILERMMGALPRAFGSPFMALSILALVAGEPLLLAAATVGAAAFYPVVLVAPAMALALWLLATPREWRGRAAEWSLARRLGVLAVTAALCAAWVLPQRVRAAEYGRAIGPNDVASFPEAGAGGRYVWGDRPPYLPLPSALVAEVGLTLRRGGSPFVAGWSAWSETGGRVRRHLLVGILLAVVAAGSACSAVRRPEVRRLLLLALAVPVAYLVARWFAPALHIPQRQLAFALPLLLFVLAPSAAGALAGFLPERSRRVGAPALTLLVPTLIVLLFGGRVGERTGLTVAVPAEDGLYEFLAELPRDVLVAGWPGERIDNVPYLSRRAILVGWETHQAYHSGYVEEMRRRMGSLVEAYFSADLVPLVALREGHGVTHVVVDLGLYRGEAPKYFAPFDEPILEAFEAGRSRGFVIPEILDRAAVFRQGDTVVLDLSRLPHEETAAGT